MQINDHRLIIIEIKVNNPRQSFAIMQERIQKTCSVKYQKPKYKFYSFFKANQNVLLLIPTIYKYDLSRFKSDPKHNVNLHDSP